MKLEIEKYNKQTMLETILSYIPELITFVGGIIGGGFILNKVQKRKVDVETDNIVINQLTERLEQQQAHNDKLEERCNKLYDDVMKHRDEKIKLREEIENLKLQIQKERLFRCERGCSKRKPQSEDPILNIDEEIIE